MVLHTHQYTVFEEKPFLALKVCMLYTWSVLNM